MGRKRTPHIHYFETPAGERMVAMSLDLLAELEDLEDLEDEVLAAQAAWERAQAATGDDFPYPLEVLQRLEAGEHPIKVWREHRRLTQAALADAVGTSNAYISQLETGHRQPSRKMLAAIANTLGVPLQALTDDARGDMADDAA